MVKIKKTNYLSREMYKNVVLNYGFRGIGILLGLVSTSVNLTYLGSSLYGQWATIASIAAWINYGDFGIGNGFRNEFAKAVANNDEEKKRKLIVSTARMLGLLTCILCILLLLITELLFILGIMNAELRIPMYITNISFCLDLFLGIGRSAAYAYQKSWLTSLAQITTVVLRIAGVLVLQNFPASLISFALINGFASLIGNVILIVLLVRQTHISFEQKLSNYIDRSLKSSIMGLGIQFFLLQIASLVLYSSDNLIISNLISSEAVTKYDIITKVYNTGENLFSILLVSLWSAVTYAVAQNDYKWITKELKKILTVWGLFSSGVVIISLLFNSIIQIWLKQSSIIYEPPIIALFAAYTIWGTFGSIFVNISNGLGRLKIQIISSIIEAVVNIPLSIFFANYLGMGIFGVKLATLCCCVGANIFVPIDVIQFLKRKEQI